MNIMNMENGAMSSLSWLSNLFDPNVLTDGASIFDVSLSEENSEKTVSVSFSDFLGGSTGDKALSMIIVSAPGVTSMSALVSGYGSDYSTYSAAAASVKESVVYADRMVFSPYFDISIEAKAKSLNNMAIEVSYSTRTVRR